MLQLGQRNWRTSHCSRHSLWKVCPQLGSTLTVTPLSKSVKQIEQHLYLKLLRPSALGVTETAEEVAELLELTEEALLLPLLIKPSFRLLSSSSALMAEL